MKTAAQPNTQRRRTVTFEVDPVALFDALHEGGTDTQENLGYQLIAVLMASANSSGKLALASYGIMITHEENH